MYCNKTKAVLIVRKDIQLHIYIHTYIGTHIKTDAELMNFENNVQRTVHVIPVTTRDESKYLSIYIHTYIRFIYVYILLS